MLSNPRTGRYTLSPDQIAERRKQRMGAIGAMQKQMGIDEDTLRQLFASTVGKSSRRQMSLDELTRCRDALVARGGKLTAPGGNGRKLAVEAQAKKLRALWLRGAELGILRDGSEAAMCSWASNSRSPEVSALLQAFTPAQFDASIERLKLWLRREIKKGMLRCESGHDLHVQDYQVMPVIESNRLLCPVCSADYIEGDESAPAIPLIWSPQVD